MIIPPYVFLLYLYVKNCPCLTCTIYILPPRKAETELWKEPADPILEAIAKIVSEEQPLWSGTASELLQLLPEIEMQPNVLTRKLNIGAEKLLIEHGVRYESNRKNSARIIRLGFVKEAE